MNKKNLALGLGGAVGAVVAWKFLTRAGEVNWEKVSGKIHHAEHSHFAEVDGATVHYQEFGEASNPTLLLIHGYTASTYVWHTVAPRFADEGFTSSRLTFSASVIRTNRRGLNIQLKRRRGWLPV